MPTANPPVQAHKLLEAFLDPAKADLSALAKTLGIATPKIAEWATATSTIEQLEKLVYVFELRLRLLAAQALPAAIQTLRQVAERLAPEAPEATIAERARFQESARRAAAQLIRLFTSSQRKRPLNPLPEGGGRGWAQDAPDSQPRSDPPAKPTPKPPFTNRQTKPTHLTHILTSTAQMPFTSA